MDVDDLIAKMNEYYQNSDNAFFGLELSSADVKVLIDELESHTWNKYSEKKPMPGRIVMVRKSVDCFEAKYDANNEFAPWIQIDDRTGNISHIRRRVGMFDEWQEVLGMPEYKFYQLWKIRQCGVCPMYNDISEECQLTDRKEKYHEIPDDCPLKEVK